MCLIFGDTALLLGTAEVSYVASRDTGKEDKREMDRETERNTQPSYQTKRHQIAICHGQENQEDYSITLCKVNNVRFLVAIIKAEV